MTTRNKVFVNRKFNCSAPKLFEWLTNPELIAKWFGPKHWKVLKVESEVKKGGTYSVELQKNSGQNLFIEGEYLEVNPPRDLTYSFNYRGLLKSPPDSTVKIILDSVSESETQLNLIQEFEIVPTDLSNRSANWNRMFDVLNEQITE